MSLSILFKNSGYKLNNKMPKFFLDLKLDQIKDALYFQAQDSYLIPYFYTPLNNLDDIKYRQDIFKDFSTIVSQF